MAFAGEINYIKKNEKGEKLYKPNVQTFKDLDFKIKSIAIDDDTACISFLDLNDEPCDIPDNLKCYDITPIPKTDLEKEPSEEYKKNPYPGTQTFNFIYWNSYRIYYNGRKIYQYNKVKKSQIHNFLKSAEIKQKEAEKRERKAIKKIKRIKGRTNEDWVRDFANLKLQTDESVTESITGDSESGSDDE